MRVFTIGRGTRGAKELVQCLEEAAVRTLVNVRHAPDPAREREPHRLCDDAEINDGRLIYVDRLWLEEVSTGPDRLIRV